MDTPRRYVAWSVVRSHTRFVPKRLRFVGFFERDSWRIGFVIWSSLSTCQQMCHQIPRLPRDKLHLTRHHPIHAQNFTIWSHSTAQVPCSCLVST